MKQDQFEALYGKVWQRFETLLLQLERNKAEGEVLPAEEFPQLYRRVCHFLSLAQERQYSSYLVEHLNDLVLRGHHQLYRFQVNVRSRLIRFLLVDFPQLVRQEQRFIWAAMALLYGPGLLIYGLILLQPELVFSLLDPVQVNQFEDMYSSDQEHVGRDRASDTDFMMFGYYIYNNISVAFRCFASGLVYMVGAVFSLAFNGLYMGAVAAHLTNVGYTETFFSFVVGHGSFELTAIGIAGGAGLKLGYSLLAPGRLTRLQSLRQAAAVTVRIMYGVILMLVIAAFIEAFWSSNGSLAAGVKYSVAAVLWFLVIGYFWRMGRSLET